VGQVCISRENTSPHKNRQLQSAECSVFDPMHTVLLILQATNLTLGLQSAQSLTQSMSYRHVARLIAMHTDSCGSGKDKLTRNTCSQLGWH
jgi:hypothetical protein